MKFKFYQTKDPKIVFFDRKRTEKPISRDCYDLVYEGGIEAKNVDEALNDLYYIFNADHPTDFCGRSMSVSDIIQIGDKAYYVDSIGFSDVTVDFI